ncbi:MAG: NIL domain-containing protein [candidate division WOR-3 bacterium]
MSISKKIVLHFPPDLTEKPITYQLVKRFDIMFNILKARVAPEDNEGLLLLELTGSRQNLEKGISYLKNLGVRTEFLSQDVIHLKEKCIHCGLCSIACPVNAFSIEPIKMTVNFESSKCIGCEECIKICPYRAVKIYFG